MSKYFFDDGELCRPISDNMAMSVPPATVVVIVLRVQPCWAQEFSTS